MNYRISNTTLIDSMKKRFIELWHRCLLPDSICNEENIYQALFLGYSDPDRRYHNLGHLIHCLYQFDLVSHLIRDPDAVEMALWFHDLVYVPGAIDNEQKSADLFLQISGNCCSDEFNCCVMNLILMTSHKNMPKTEDEKFIVDIDLSSMGLNWNVFLIDTDNLRKERTDMSDSEYCRRHNDFLNALLARQRIFHTDFFHSRFEQAATENILRLLAKRNSQGLK